MKIFCLTVFEMRKLIITRYFVVTENKIDSYIAMCGEALYISFSNNKNQVYKWPKCCHVIIMVTMITRIGNIKDGSKALSMCFNQSVQYRQSHDKADVAVSQWVFLWSWCGCKHSSKNNHGDKNSSDKTSFFYSNDITISGNVVSVASRDQK